MQRAEGVTFAKAYAQRGLSMRTLEEVAAQISYLQSNLGKWRGERARRVKVALRQLHAEVSLERRADAD